jgi:hypothetical protein
MSRTRRNRSTSIYKKLKNTTSSAIPLVDKGLTSVGMTAKGIAYKSKPILEKGVSALYGTIASGFDLGVKGTKSVAKGVNSLTQKKHRRRHRRGGKRSCRKY